MLRFAVPDYLYLLAAIPLLTAVYLFAVRSRRRRLERFGNPQTLAELMPEASPTRMRNKAVFFLTALALLQWRWPVRSSVPNSGRWSAKGWR